MKRTMIKDKLAELGISVESLNLGDFDIVGELCARKRRGSNDPLYKKVGAFFRPNYERGILISSLIKKFNAKKVLEIGFGRGYMSMCAVKAMEDMGWGDDAAVYSCDINIDENHLKMLAQSFPREWFKRLNLIKGTVKDALANVADDFDLIAIDGDHTYEGVKNDFNAVKDRYTKLILMDDYDPESTSSGMQVARFVDELSDVNKELLITDRRIFFDDRGYRDDDIKYGQVLITHPSFDVAEALGDW